MRVFTQPFECIVYPPSSPEDAALLDEGMALCMTMHALNASRVRAQVEAVAARISAAARPLADSLVEEAIEMEEGHLAAAKGRREMGMHPVPDHLRHLVTPEEEAVAGLT